MQTVASPEAALDRVRSARRLPVQWPILVRIEPQGEPVELVCANISRTGAFVCSDVLFEVGMPLWCSIVLPDGGRFDCAAEVARIDDRRVGLGPGLGLAFGDACAALEALG